MMSKIPYIPSELPLKNLQTGELTHILGKANSSLARFDGIMISMINPIVLLSPLANQEAVLSSKIEGTQATLQEVLKHESGKRFDQQKNEDIQEIQNYRLALLKAQEHIKDRPLNKSLLLSIHKILLESVRGQNKAPGKFRKTQNWIGPKGCKIEDATFIPPSPLQLQDHLNKFEEYIQFDDIDVLIQAGIIHAQFELLHPFLDGNGRIGRLLIPLFLYFKKAINAPMFYISQYLERNREEYYHRLQMISEQNQWVEWLIFFLNAIKSQAEVNTNKGQKIVALYEETKRDIHEATHSQYAMLALDFIFNKPIFTAPELCRYADFGRPTGNGIVNKLCESGVITTVQESAGRRPAIFAFSELLHIAESNE